MDAHFFRDTLCAWCMHDLLVLVWEKTPATPHYLSKSGIVEVTTALGLETWQWTLKGQPPPRQLSLQPSLHYPAIAWGPITPAALPVSLFPFLLLFHYLCLLLSLSLPSSFSRFLSPGSLYPVLSRAPCVTRLIKTNTDPILVSNPIVLFFFSPTLEHAEY